MVNVLEDLTIQDSNEQLDDEDLRETIHDLISESQYRIKDFLENEDKSQYSAAELKALMMLSSFNAKLYKGRIEEQNKAKFASFTQAENVLAEELNKKPADGETLNNNASHETANNADKEAVVNPVSQDNAEEEVDDAANAAAEKEEQEKQRQQEAEKARKEQERKEAEEGQPTTKEEDTPSPYQKWKEKLEAVKEKGDIHALLAFANEALQHKNDFKDYKHKGAKNEKINAFAWLSDNIDKKTLPKHSIEWLTPSDIEIFKNLAQARIDEFRFTSGRRQSLIGVRTKQEKNVFVDLLLKEGKDFIENKNDIIKTAENKEQQKDLLKKLEKWKELYSTKFYKDVYVIDENNKIEDLLKLLDEEIAKLQQTLENTNQNPNDNGNSNGIVPDDNGNEEPVVEINVGGEDLNPDNSGGDDEGTGDDNGDDGNDDTPDDVEPIIELDDFDELVVNHATEPDLIPSTETLANLIEQKCTEKDIANTRENDNFTLFADEADKDKPEKANGKISVIGNNNVDIISSEFKVYKAAVEAAKEKGAKKIAITSKNADGSLRDLSDSTEGEKNKKALAHLFLACAQSGLEAQTTPEIEAAVQTYPEYQTYKLTKAKNEAYAELSLKISSLSDDQKNEYQRLKNEFKTASDDTGKRAAQADLLRFETTNGIGALKQKVKDTTLAQYNYYIENGQHFGEPTDDAAKAARKTQIKEAYDRYQNRGDHYQNADDNSEVKGAKALEIAMYKRLINETTI